MLALPFVAGKGERSLLRRPWAVAIVILVVLMVGTLSVVGQLAPWSPALTAQPLSPEVVASDDPQIQRGASLFHERGCEYCHVIGGQGGDRGPDLSTVGSRLTRERIVTTILN